VSELPEADLVGGRHLKFLSEHWYFRTRERWVTWIAEGDGPLGRQGRLAAVVGGVFALFYVLGDRAREWWIIPAVLSLGLIGLFAFWRAIEWRRRVARTANPPVRTMDLPR
jgi:hypothetical protein